jgi:hypothetical protein
MTAAQHSQTKFYLDRLSTLVGGEITGLVRSGEDEFGDEFFGITIKLKDGKLKHLVLLSDDEGNAPGSFEITEGESHG